jgi:hypothetical protein
MSGQSWLPVPLACACLTTLAHPLGAMTVDYSTSAKALAEAGWYDAWFGDVVADPVEDSDKATGARSYADAYWDEIKYAGKLGINIAASAKVEPNLIVLTTDLSGSFRSEAGTPLLTYFYQEAQGTVDAIVCVDEFPPGTPCSLRYDVSWPQDTWTGEYYWRFEVTSYVERVECGYDANGPYGSRNDQITVYAGEPVHIFLVTVGAGLNEIGAGNTLGVGRIQLDVRLTVTRQITDLKTDGFVNFKDVAVFARQWRRSDPNSAEAAPYAAADFNGSGNVDIDDLKYFAYYWLLTPRPDLVMGQGRQ